MPIAIIAVHANQSIPASLAVWGVRILSGVVECVFRGDPAGAVVRDTLTFNVGRVNLGTGGSPIASCTMSLASVAFDGAVNNALWAVDAASVPAFVNPDRGTGTADLQVVGNLAVRAPAGVILRVNYVVFHSLI
jgi:hypothetical protein